MLDIQHLTKTYGEKKAVDDLSLRIAPGGDLRLHRAQRRRQDDDAQGRRRHPAI